MLQQASPAFALRRAIALYSFNLYLPMQIKRTAVCACGATTIAVNGPPITHGVCHCTNCKRRTGSAFGISSYFPRSSVVERTGETKIYAFHHAAQDHRQERHFCPTCGTTLLWFISSLPDLIGIAAGCFADEGLPAPTYSLTHRKCEEWVTLPSAWKVCEE
jgi:hypothetical protein